MEVSFERHLKEFITDTYLLDCNDSLLTKLHLFQRQILSEVEKQRQSIQHFASLHPPASRHPPTPNLYLGFALFFNFLGNSDKTNGGIRSLAVLQMLHSLQNEDLWPTFTKSVGITFSKTICSLHICVTCGNCHSIQTCTLLFCLS